MSWLLEKLGAKAAAIGAALAAFLAILWRARQDGKNAMKLEQEERRAEARQARKELDDEVDGLGHADLDHRFNKWVRPEQR